ncbi:Na(+)/H(+) antiporter subunit B [Spirillospora sp. CA-128828]|uniref:Na(+)/H(+) antiporter subunit B n=1 Tax=Spirillospora sp. CA-128828 TaxID=3240033 RepID=UPI003D92D117
MTVCLGAGSPDALSGPLADALIAAALVLSALMATAVVLTRDTVRQAIVLSGYGMVLGLLFVILQAPDVAMSQIGVGTVLVPLIVVLALHATRRYRDTGGDGGPSGEHTCGQAGEQGGDGREARR